jgi:hydroxyacylglutathione hydrolase
MITIKIFVFNAFQENTYVLSDETNECAIIDAGCYSDEEYKQLFDYISNNKLKPKQLLQTHGHIDHVLGVTKVSEQFVLPIKSHKKEVKLIAQAQEHGIIFGFNANPLPEVSNYLEEGLPVKFGNSVLQVFHVPGHSKGSVAFYSEPDKFVITGDVLFKGSIGRTDLPGGDYDELMTSIFTKLLTLPNDTFVHPGHGPSTTIGVEAKSNPFLIG